MLDTNDKATLTDALTRHLHALQHGGNDDIAGTANTLDIAAAQLFGEDPDEENSVLNGVICSLLSEERTSTDAVAWCRAALLITGTL